MKGVRKKLIWAAVLSGMMILLSMNAWADNSQTPRDFPGWNGSGTKIGGPGNSDDYFDFWDDEEDDDDGRETAVLEEGGITALQAGGFSTVTAHGLLTAGNL